MKGNGFLIQTIYGIMVACFLMILLWAGIYFDGLQMRGELAENNVNAEEGWSLEDGSEADLRHLQRIPGIEPYQEMSVYYTLPQELTDDVSLCFRSKNINYQVYVEGELRFEPYSEENVVYLKSQGTRWNFISLASEDAGRVVEIRFEIVYENATACMDHMVLGRAAGQLLDIVAEKAVAAVTAGLIIILGLILCVMDIPVNMQKEKNHELLYLGIFAVVIGCWCFTETNILQLFCGDSRMIQLMSCLLLSLLPIPLMLYLNASMEIKPEKLIKGICYVSALQFVFCTVLHFLGIADYHETLTLAHIVLVVTALTLFVTSFKNSFRFSGEQDNYLYQTLRGIGLISIAVTAMLDVIRYYLRTGGDNAMFIRFGLFVFIACYGTSSLERTINAVKKGVHMEFVSQLAYMDGLTGIGNRTAFQEKLEELEVKKDNGDSVGIVIFDVNNLKKINDTFGHSEGDRSIKISAELIEQAFTQVKGECYRIGGDEFAVVLDGEDVEQRCESSIGFIVQELVNFNREKKLKYELHIASGYAVYDKNCPDMKLTDIFELADAKMYENKKKMKNKS